MRRLFNGNRFFFLYFATSGDFVVERQLHFIFKFWVKVLLLLIHTFYAAELRKKSFKIVNEV